MTWARARELIKALDGQDCPCPIVVPLQTRLFSCQEQKYNRQNLWKFGLCVCGYVMLLVINQVPDAMDHLLAEFNRVCIYTVPRHLHALNEENGQLESIELSDICCCISCICQAIYAATIQTEITSPSWLSRGMVGWKWLAMFLNALPDPTATAYTLHAFLKMAGFALHKKYGSQFKKILVSRCFLPALKEQGNKMQSEAVNNLQNHLMKNLPRGTRGAVPCPTTDIERVVLGKIKDAVSAWAIA